MSIISAIVNGISSWFASRSDIAKAKYEQRKLKKEYQTSVRNQWNRLFSGEDYIAILFLKSFEQSNDWIEMPYDIAEYNFGGYGYDYCNIEFKEETYNLFQTNGQKIRITPIVYPIFSKQLKKAIKIGLVQ